MAASGKPVVLVLVNGGPISIEWESANVGAIVEAWEPGANGGEAIANVIFGDYNPGGRMPFSVPRSVGHQYAHYKQKKSAFSGGKFLDSDASSLYEFGFGLSFTSFEYSNVIVKDTINIKDDVRVSVDVKNTGSIAGDEVVLVFMNDVISTVAAPVKELAAFKRVSLQPGEVRRVEFVISSEQLSLLNAEMQRVVEPGKFEIIIGVDKAAKIISSFNVRNN